MAARAVAAVRGQSSGNVRVVSGTERGRLGDLPELRMGKGDLALLANRFLMDHFDGANLSRCTRKNYVGALRCLVEGLEAAGHSLLVREITKRDVQLYLAGRLATRAATTVAKRDHALLRVFFRWVAQEPDMPAGWPDPMVGLKAPKVEQEDPPVLDIEQVRALVRECEREMRSPSEQARFEALRDGAIARVLFDTGVRRGELAGMTLADAQRAVEPGRMAGRLWVDGKTGKREVDLSGRTRVALSRYLAVRRTHRFQAQSGLWLGQRGTLTGDGLYVLMRKRARAAGIEKWWLHVMRHTSTHIQLEAGAREHHLARTMGWSSTAMVGRYARKLQAQRALDEHRELAIGDLI